VDNSGDGRRNGGIRLASPSGSGKEDLMSRRAWMLTVCAVFALSGIGIVQALGRTTDEVPAVIVTSPDEWLSNPAAQRWLAGQPNHWHSCLLQK
jgi:hypothetical protein